MADSCLATSEQYSGNQPGSQQGYQTGSSMGSPCTRRLFPVKEDPAGARPTLLYTLMAEGKHKCIFKYVIPGACMWSDIIREFADSPSQGRVVRFLLENGFGVNAEGRICCNGIEIPATSVAKAIGWIAVSWTLLPGVFSSAPSSGRSSSTCGQPRT